MKKISFRLRIALLSSLLAGTALAGFGVFSWWLIYQAKLTRLDNDIKTQLLQESDQPRPRPHWQSYAPALQFALSAADSAQVGLWVQTADSQTIYQSSTWTADLRQAVTFLPVPPDADPARLRPDTNPEPMPPIAPRDRPFSPDRPFPPNRPPIADPASPVDTDALPQPQQRPPRHVRLTTTTTATGTWRIGTIATPFVKLAIAVNVQTVYTEMAPIQNAFLITIPITLLFIAVGSWWLSVRTLQPIRELTGTLRKVTAKGLDQRVPTSNRDREFVELLQVFNQMMERLERSFHQASRFSADAAHELKTPLAILQGELERTLQAAAPGSELQQRLSHLLDEVRRLSSIIRQLLLLSLADAGQMRLHQVDVNLSQLLTDLAEDIDLLAPDLTVQVTIPPTLRVRADQTLLTQILQNLISNAIKYNLPNGWIRITAGTRQQTVFVTVTNASQDIPAQARSRIFDRFHRGDPSHTRQIEGLGLGLSLSREIAYAHQGNLTLDPSPSGQTTFTLALPAPSRTHSAA